MFFNKIFSKANDSEFFFGRGTHERASRLNRPKAA